MAGPLARRADRIQAAVRSSVVDIRVAAARAATERLRNELLTASIRVEVAVANAIDLGASAARATVIAGNYARDWLRVATETGSAQQANAELQRRTVTVAATETSDAYNDARAKHLHRIPQQRVELFKVWDALLDRRTCPICAAADGRIVGIRESFPGGRPGSVHPLCRCTETILRADEVDGSLLIQPARISLVPAA